MKIKAAIVLLTFIVFIAQTIQIPLKCEVVKNTSECSACPMMAMHKACRNKETQKPKQENSDKSKCADCPFFAVLMFPDVSHFESTIPAIESKCASLINNNLSDYAQESWKPPNAFFLF